MAETSDQLREAAWEFAAEWRSDFPLEFEQVVVLMTVFGEMIVSALRVELDRKERSVFQVAEGNF
jgi:ATP-dependent protease HslVU (ClpYQ) peptidase subunit